jgi:hypothetical protein
MSKKILILGESGSGKSTSLRNLDPKETFIINVIGKDLPFKGWKSAYKPFSKENPDGNLYNTYNPNLILKLYDKIKERNDIKNIIIDDFQYIMSYEFMERAKERGYDKFTEIGQNAFNVIKLASDLRDDQIVVFLTHSEEIITEQVRKVKTKTVGKLLDEKITIEGLFTVVLYSVVENNVDGLNYYFITKSDGTNPAKSPMGMFPEVKMPNDLNLIIDLYKQFQE